jgi:antitoxin (DNA-binding transcriptional repressor) of toxin-antitoxin stability system
MPTAVSVRKSFSSAVTSATHGSVTTISRRGKQVAAIVPISLVQMVEKIEDELLLERMPEIMRQAKASTYVRVHDVRDLL